MKIYVPHIVTTFVFAENGTSGGDQSHRKAGVTVCRAVTVLSRERQARQSDSVREAMSELIPTST